MIIWRGIDDDDDDDDEYATETELKELYYIFLGPEKMPGNKWCALYQQP